MVTMYDVQAEELIKKLSEELKKNPEIKPPAWALWVKTGAHKERPPVNKDWWYIRAAAILRSVAKLGPIGVSKLRTKYGGKKNRGFKPERFYKGSGSIIRKILQQLEKTGYVKQTERGLHKGRSVTPEGQRLLDRIANQILGKKQKPEQAERKVSEKSKEAKETKEEETKKVEKTEKTEKTEEINNQTKNEKPTNKTNKTTQKISQKSG